MPLFAIAKSFRKATLGRVYMWGAVLTCMTGFGIFQHGGFGKPHVLGVATLLVLAVAALPGSTRFSVRWRYFTTFCYTLTVFFQSGRSVWGAP